MGTVIVSWKLSSLLASPFPPSEGEKGEPEAEAEPEVKALGTCRLPFAPGVPSVEKNFVLSDSPFSPSEGGKGAGGIGGQQGEL